MSAERKAIRHAIKEALIDETRAGSRVDTNRATPHRKSQLPALTIYSRSEDSQKHEAHGSHMRTARVAVELFQQEPGTGVLVDDDLDDFAEEVEPAVLGYEVDGMPLGLEYVQEVTLSQVEVDVDDQGERLNGSCRITFDVRYLWEVRPPKQDRLAPFTGANTKYDETTRLGVDAEDHVDIPVQP